MSADTLINSLGIRTLKKNEKTQVLVFRFQNGGDSDFFSYEVDLASNAWVVFQNWRRFRVPFVTR